MVILMSNKIIVIGNGIAAITAVKTIRETDLDSEIYLFGEEKFYPYNRIRLSKGIFSNLLEDNVLLQKKEWYEQNKINIFTDTRVVNVNTDIQTITIEDGNKLKYDKLLFACGASNRIPTIEGIDKNGVVTLRGLNDALEIRKKLENCETVVILGGGIQGLETAWVLNRHGKKVIVIELIDRLMPHQLDNKASEILRNKIESYGIEIKKNTKLKKILGDNKVSGILINDDEEIKCDLVIYSIGIKPNLELTEKTDIKTRRGILVNNKMETNIKNVYAVGDVAEFNDSVNGLWNIAILQGKVAGGNIVKRDILYENITPMTTLNAFELSLFSMGSILSMNCGEKIKIIEENCEATEKTFDEDSKNHTKEYKKIFIKDNNIVGAIVIGDTKKTPLLKNAIEKKIYFDEKELENITVNEILDKLKNK